MVIYEVIATVEADLTEKYEKYMREKHISELLATGYFRGAEIARADAGRYCIRYIAHDQSALDNYLSREANRLRMDFAAHFPEGVEVSREVWTVIESWKS
jgi:hypothetical protein